MDDQPQETPASAAQESAGTHASTNGNLPPHPADLEHQMRLTLSALESVDMRLANIQATNLMIFGAIVLVFALELRIFKAVGE